MENLSTTIFNSFDPEVRKALNNIQNKSELSLTDNKIQDFVQEQMRQLKEGLEVLAQNPKFSADMKVELEKNPQLTNIKKIFEDIITFKGRSLTEPHTVLVDQQATVDQASEVTLESESIAAPTNFRIQVVNAFTNRGALPDVYELEIFIDPSKPPKISDLPALIMKQMYENIDEKDYPQSSYGSLQNMRAIPHINRPCFVLNIVENQDADALKVLSKHQQEGKIPEIIFIKKAGIELLDFKKLESCLQQLNRPNADYHNIFRELSQLNREKNLNPEHTNLIIRIIERTLDIDDYNQMSKLLDALAQHYTTLNSTILSHFLKKLTPKYPDLERYMHSESPGLDNRVESIRLKNQGVNQLLALTHSEFHGMDVREANIHEIDNILKELVSRPAGSRIGLALNLSSTSPTDTSGQGHFAAAIIEKDSEGHYKIFLSDAASPQRVLHSFLTESKILSKENSEIFIMPSERQADSTNCAFYTYRDLKELSKLTDVFSQLQTSGSVSDDWLDINTRNIWQDKGGFPKMTFADHPSLFKTTQYLSKLRQRDELKQALIKEGETLDEFVSRHSYKGNILKDEWVKFLLAGEGSKPSHEYEGKAMNKYIEIKMINYTTMLMKEVLRPRK